MNYQKIESTLYEFIGFNDGETHAYYRRKGNQRVEKVKVGENTVNNIPKTLSSIFSKSAKAKPTEIPDLHFLDQVSGGIPPIPPSIPPSLLPPYMNSRTPLAKFRVHFQLNPIPP